MGKFRVLVGFFLISFLCCYVGGAAAEDSEQSFSKKHEDYLDLVFFDPSDVYFSYLQKPKHVEHGQPEKTDTGIFYFELDAGYEFTADTMMFADIEFEQSLYDFDTPHNSNRPLGSPDLYQLASLMGVAHYFSDDLVGLIDFYPGVSTEFGHGMKARSFGWAAGPVVGYRLSPRFALHGGVQVSEDYYETTIYPIGGISYLSEDGRTHVNITAPFQYRVGYLASDAVEVYSSVWYSDAKSDAWIGPKSTRSWVSVGDIQAGAGALWTLGDYITLTTEFGAAFGNNFRVEKGAVADVGDDSDVTPYAMVAIGFTFEAMKSRGEN